MEQKNECQHCTKSLSVTDLQYVFKMGDHFYSMHMNCAEEPIDVYTVHWDGELKHVACIESVVEYLLNLQKDEAITIKKRNLTRIQYLTMPEL